MRNLILLTLIAAILFVGCASNKKTPQAKKTFERPWISGSFETADTPTFVRTNTGGFGKQGLLLAHIYPDTPLTKAGLQEGDLLLTANGRKLRREGDLQKVVDHTGPNPLTLTIYRGGQISEKSVTPGIERFQKLNMVAFGFFFGTKFDVDIFPNPDFSLGPIGHNTEHKRLELRDAASRYRNELKLAEGTGDQNGWQGLRSKEGRKTWFGPFVLEQRKMIISQEAPQ